jgi:hypothetical protein
MPLAEHDNVVKTFPPDRTDRSFTISVLPRRSQRGWPIPNAHRPKAADEDVSVDGDPNSEDPASLRSSMSRGRSNSVSPRTSLGSWMRSALFAPSIPGGCCRSGEPTVWSQMPSPNWMGMFKRESNS